MHFLNHVSYSLTVERLLADTDVPWPHSDRLWTFPVSFEFNKSVKVVKT